MLAEAKEKSDLSGRAGAGCCKGEKQRAIQSYRGYGCA